MNAKSLFAAAAIAFVGTAAFAQDVQNHPTPSTLTRAQVQAELASYAGRPSSQVEVFGSNKQAVAAVRDGKVSANATRLARVEVRRDLAAGDNAATIVGGSSLGQQLGAADLGWPLCRRSTAAARQPAWPARRGGSPRSRPIPCGTNAARLRARARIRRSTRPPRRGWTGSSARRPCRTAKLDRSTHSSSSTTVTGTNSVEPSATQRAMRRLAAASCEASSWTM
jgi:hypothetical protein